MNVSNGEGYFMAAPRVLSHQAISRTLVDLEQAVADRDQTRAVECLRQLVPEYQPDNGGSDNVVFLGSKVAGKA